MEFENKNFRLEIMDKDEEFAMVCLQVKYPGMQIEPAHCFVMEKKYLKNLAVDIEQSLEISEEEKPKEILEAEARGFVAALRYMEDRELPMAFKSAFNDRPDHFHKHLSKKLVDVSWGDRSEFYRIRMDEECQRKILEHYMS